MSGSQCGLANPLHTLDWSYAEIAPAFAPITGDAYLWQFGLQPLSVMTGHVTSKCPAIQQVVAMLMRDLGPDRVAVSGETEADSESVTICSRTDPSRAVHISVAGMEDGRYCVTCDYLRTKQDGRAHIEARTANGLVYESVHWLTRKTFEDGVILGEFGGAPPQRRLRV